MASLDSIRRHVPDRVKTAVRHGVPARVRDLVRPSQPAASRPWLQSAYAQAGEDLLIRFLFGMLEIERPTYLDIGAFHPWRYSNTALLYLDGSRGINVEADPDSAALIRRHRPHDQTLAVGCGPEPGRMTFFRMSAPTLNTFSRAAAEAAVEESGGRYQVTSTVAVEIRTVAQILAGRPCPDLVSLDVEGMDVDILRTLPTWGGRPAVVCVETATYSETGGSRKLTEPAELLARHGYIQFADTWMNTIFVRDDLYQR
jgi:FkbM family methyltransferase